jgi:hypothetical protein
MNGRPRWTISHLYADPEKVMARSWYFAYTGSMGFAADVERAQKLDRERRDRDRAVDAVVQATIPLLFALQHEEDIAVAMGRIADAVEEKLPGARVSAASAPEGESESMPLQEEVVSAEGLIFRSQTTFKAETLDLMRSNPTGVALDDVASIIYRNEDGVRARHKARSMLDYLTRRGDAHRSAASGRWVLGPEPGKVRDLAKEDEDGSVSATPLVRRVLSEAKRPLLMKDIVAAVVSYNSATPKPHIYSAMHKMKNRGDVTKLGEAYALRPRNGGQLPTT